MSQTVTTTHSTGSSDPDPELRRHLMQSIEERRERLIRLRQRLHASPERSGREFETTKLVAQILEEHGLEPRRLEGDVGVVVDIDLGAPSKPLVALRCEIDAVVVNDDKQVPYASTQPGLCHACGHDVHATVQMACGVVLAEHRERLSHYAFRHNLRLIFQPAEETATGARSMIRQGVLSGVEGIMAIHVDPSVESGRITVRYGPMTSATKEFRVSIRGRSGHSARPHEAVDPIPAATTIVSLFYQLAPRSMDSRYPLALTVASIQSGAAANAIPDCATIRGTLRAARSVDVEAVQKRMESVVRGVREATGCDVDLEFPTSCPATNNDPELVDLLRETTEESLGAGSLEELEAPSLGAEDFAYYQELVPGAIVRLGSAAENVRLRRPLHSSLFDVHPDTLEHGARFVTWSAVRMAASFAPRFA